MFPWNLLPNQNNQINDWMKKINDSGIEKQIDQLLNKFKDNPSFSNVNKNERKSENENITIIETIDFIFVTIYLNEKINKERLSISYSYNQLYIKGLDDTNDAFICTLPSLVRKSNAEVRKVDNKIEVKFPKFHDHNLVELDLS